MEKKHFVYILLTENDTLYCGYTDNVKKRFQAHLEGKGAKYTKANRPIRVLWQKEFLTKTEALKEEYDTVYIYDNMPRYRFIKNRDNDVYRCIRTILNCQSNKKVILHTFQTI